MQFLSKDRKFYMQNGKFLKCYSLPVKGDLVELDLDGNGDKQYRVLSINGNIAKLLGMDDISTLQKYNATSKTGTFINGNTGQLYAGSDLDTYLNTTWYNTLSTTAKAAIVPESRTQYMYEMYDEPNTANISTYTYQYQCNWNDSDYDNANLIDSILVGDRNVFALDLKDIFDYFGKSCITSNELMELWTNQTNAVSQNWWLSSAYIESDNSDFIGVWSINGLDGVFAGSSVGFSDAVRPAFNIDLSKMGFVPSSGGGQVTSQAIEWHQCPEAVRNYLANVTYDPSDYSTSEIANYAPSTAIVSNYKPIGTTVDGITYYNEVPNIATPFASTNIAGTLKPLDSLRYIKTNTWNVRDLGGWTCDGGTVKYGLLFRGGEPSTADYNVLVKQLGIRYDLNLRGATEAPWTKSPLGDDVFFVKADAYNWYSLANTEAWQINLRCVFDAVTHNEPIYFHCAAGADRTGTLACVLEGLLGMSQSDIDKDYELTTFYSGSDTDANARRRNESEWKGLIAEINAKSGNTFRDKCVTFAAELGFTAAEINAFRKAMIDGTPETVSPSISTFSITNTLNGVTTNNTTNEATQYQPYEAIISTQDGNAINSVTIMMNNVDITASAWQGDETLLYHKVTLNLNNCFMDNKLSRVIDGQSYGANVSPEPEYTLDGATVSITMGGTDMSNYYSGGKIAIPKVTGDIIITISAVENGVVTPNILTDSFKAGGVSYSAIGYRNGKRLSTATGELKDNTNSCVTGFIPMIPGSTVRIKPYVAPASADGSTGMVVYSSDKTFLNATNIITSTSANHFANCTYEQESTDIYKITFNSNLPTTYAYVRFTIPSADGTNVYITYDAEMPNE